MLGDPKECRACAALCLVLAVDAMNPVARMAFSDLARQWTKLATDIEMAVALSDRFDFMRPCRASG